MHIKKYEYDSIKVSVCFYSRDDENDISFRNILLVSFKLTNSRISGILTIPKVSVYQYYENRRQDEHTLKLN